MGLHLDGMKFGKWSVIKRSCNKQHSTYKWICKCDCGVIHEVSGSDLTQGKSKSCGCVNTERIVSDSTSHGMSSHHLYNTWKSMVSRCCNKKNTNYYLYGGRGISVCVDWMSTPEKFIRWACDNGWGKGKQIDRIDNNLGYTPENCRFVTPGENANNRRVKRIGSSMFIGVSFISANKNNPWRAVIFNQRKAEWVKYFKSEEEAARARDNEMISSYPGKKRDAICIARFG